MLRRGMRSSSPKGENTVFMYFHTMVEKMTNVVERAPEQFAFFSSRYLLLCPTVQRNP